MERFIWKGEGGPIVIKDVKTDHAMGVIKFLPYDGPVITLRISSLSAADWDQVIAGVRFLAAWRRYEADRLDIIAVAACRYRANVRDGGGA